jgi:outer membrane protein OmpA-like peptidoglycan-associated protein
MKKLLLLVAVVPFTFTAAQSQSFSLTDSSFSVNDTLAKRIDFEFEQAIIPNESKPFLDSLASLMLAHTHLKMEVGNYIDYRGNDILSFKLTKKRADAVMAYLVHRGVPAARLTAVGYVERKQVYPEQKVTRERVYDFRMNMLAASNRMEFKILSVSFK